MARALIISFSRSGDEDESVRIDMPDIAGMEATVMMTSSVASGRCQ